MSSMHFTCVARVCLLSVIASLFAACSESANGPCQPGSSCVAAGAACATNDDCSSGHCADGVCCDSACDGTCVSCLGIYSNARVDGKCGLTLAGVDPRLECGAASCSGGGTCNVLNQGSPCTANKQCGTGYCADGFCCDSPCDGACEQCGSNGLCGVLASAPDPGTCDDKVAAGSCNTPPCGCNDAAECTAGGGQPCGGGQMCADGLACVDGVCCNSSCDRACYACLEAETGKPNGVCATALVHMDPHDRCPGALVCAEGGVCFDKANGEDCSGASECHSGVCYGGTCCDQQCGYCQACGIEHQVAGGTDGSCWTETRYADVADVCDGGSSCDGSGNCYNKGPGVACADARECVSGFCVNGACCNTACNGTICMACVEAFTGLATGTCGPVVEDKFSPSNSCSCDGHGRCQNPRGQGCANDYECAQGVCVSAGARRFCCNEQCGALCKSCLGADTDQGDGTCNNVVRGRNPNNTCLGSSCAGDGACIAQYGQYCSDDYHCYSGWCGNAWEPTTCKKADGEHCDNNDDHECGTSNCTSSKDICEPTGTNDDGRCLNDRDCRSGDCRSQSDGTKKCHPN